MAMSLSLTFVVPVRNDAQRLQRCLGSIAANGGAANREVIVVDNGSSDASAAVGASAGATVMTLPDITVAAARNAGGARATGTLLAFVDADHLLDPTWVESALEIFRQDSVTAAGAPYSTPANANWIQRAYGRLRPVLPAQQATDWLASGNLVIRRDAFEAVNGFDGSLEACEDVDLCARLRQAGFQLVADPRLRSVHLGDPSTLRALFLGELWRGRNNLKVTLRGPLTLSALPSVAIPLVNLAALAVIVMSPWIGGWRVALGAAALSAAFVCLRAARTTMRSGVGVLAFVQNLVVATVYESARALALVFRATHRTRREMAGERAVA
jgi:GT2 family glycosyltransferase